MYFCNKTMTWKESQSMPKSCPVKGKKKDIPKGYSVVAYERKGNLYIESNGFIHVVKSPYEQGKAPKYVKLCKNKQGNYYIDK